MNEATWFCSRVTAADVHDVEQRRDDAVFDVHEKRFWIIFCGAPTLRDD
ncbi:hypothetical protein [Streptomyces sioyaensis]